MKNVYLYAYNEYSKSAKDLAQALGIKRIKHKNSKFKGNPNKIVINWGASNLPDEVHQCVVLNSDVEACVDKLKFFEKLKGTNITPEFCTSIDDAERMLGRGKEVVCRTILNGYSGKGIVIAKSIDEIVEAPLYTQYIPKKDEYRIHIVDNKIIFMQRKARNLEVKDDFVNWKIRNHDNGFIFAHKDLQVPEIVSETTLNCHAILGIQFGAYDVVYNEKNNKAYVLECNTACGLEGETLNSYVNAFKGVL